MAENNNVLKINGINLLKDYMKDYYEEILHNRAMIAIEDGLKPIQRKLLYSFKDKGHTSGKGFTKSVISVGEVLRFSPHGDASAYEAAVNMSHYMNNIPLLELHGGNKTIYGSTQSASRYTEMRTSKFSDMVLLDNVERKYNAVNYVKNFDESLYEPEYLPSKFPIFLLNGTLGIAGGFMCSILPHSVEMIADKTIQLINNPDIEVDEFIKDFKPDFPTGGIVSNMSVVTNSYKKPSTIKNVSSGVCIIRAKMEYVEKGNYIKIYEIPYYITTEKIIESIKECIKTESIKEISSFKNLSAKGKIDIRVYLKRGSDENSVIGKLYKLTPCQNSIPIVNIMTYNGKIKIYENVKEMLLDWLEFRITTIKRIHNTILKDYSYTKHIKEGIYKICSDPKNIDKLIAIVRSKKLTKEEIFEKTKNTFDLSDRQTEHILATKIVDLSDVSIDDLYKEIVELEKNIDDEINFLSNDKNILTLIKEEITDIKKKFAGKKYNGNNFKTEYQDLNFDEKAIIEDSVADEDFILILSKFGFLKKIKIDDNIKSQKRRGAGNSIGKFKSGDSPLCNITCNSKDNILLFTEDGYSYKYKCYELPNTSENIANTIGKTILGFTDDKKVVGIIALSDEEYNDDNLSVITLTKYGKLKATYMNEFVSSFNCLKAVELIEGDKLQFVTTCDLLDVTNKEILICNKAGFVLKNDVSEIKVGKRRTVGNDSFSRKSTNEKGREILSCEIVDSKSGLIFVYNNGLIKKCDSEEFPKNKFRTIGVKTGIREDSELVSCISYNSDNDVVNLISNKKSINIRVSEITKVRRTAFGNISKKLEDDEYIVSATLLDGENIKSTEKPKHLINNKKNK